MRTERKNTVWQDLPGFWDTNRNLSNSYNIREHILNSYVKRQKVYSTSNYRDCQKNTGDKTWDVSEKRDRALGYHHRDRAQCLVIVKSSSKP